MQQEDIDLGGIGNDVKTTAAGPEREVDDDHHYWQMLIRDSSIGIGKMLLSVR